MSRRSTLWPRPLVRALVNRIRATGGPLVVACLLCGLTVVSAYGSASYLLEWGANGSGNGQFSFTTGIAVDANGDVYVGDAGNSRIQKFDADGNYLLQWGSAGADSGQFSSNPAVDVGPGGNVYVADQGNNRIQVFTNTGVLLSLFGTSGSQAGEFNAPRDVAVDATGNIYVTDGGNHRVQKFDAAGTFLAEWGSLGSGQGQFNVPRGIDIGPGGAVYVTDRNNHRVQRFDANGVFELEWGGLGSGDGQMNAPLGVTVDPAGDVLVVESSGRRVQKFDADGVYICKWGSLGSGPGQFAAPFDLELGPQGDVYVSDTNNHRVQRFRGTIFIGGLGHEALGAGQIELEQADPTSLIVHNIGSSGLDGVAIDLQEQTTFSMRLDRPDTLVTPPGSWTRVRLRGRRALQASYDFMDVRLIDKTTGIPTFKMHLDVDSTLIDPGTPLDEQVMYEVLDGCSVVGSVLGPPDSVETSLPAFKGFGNPDRHVQMFNFSRVVEARVDDADNRPMVSVEVDQNMDFTLPGGMTFQGRKLRMRVLKPPVQLEIMDEVRVLAKDVPTMRLGQERPRKAQKKGQFGFDHTPVGYAEIDDSGGVITVNADSLECEAIVGVTLDDAASVTTEFDLPDMATLPDGASLHTRLRGCIGAGPLFDVAEITRTKVSATQVDISYNFHPDVVPSGENAQFIIVSLDGLPPGTPVSGSNFSVTVQKPDSMQSLKCGNRIAGPGDPYNGVDVSIMGQPNTNGPGARNQFGQRFDSPMMITFPGQPPVMGAGFVIVSNLGSSGQDGVALKRMVVESRQIPSFTLQSESTGHAPQETLDGVDHTGMGNTGFTTMGDTLRVSNIGSSGLDGVAVDVGTGNHGSIGTNGPVWDDVPNGSWLSDVFKQVGSTNNEVEDEQFIAYRGRQKDNTLGPAGVRFGHIYAPVAGGGSVLYEALMGGGTEAQAIDIPEAISSDNIMVYGTVSKGGVMLSSGSPFDGVTDVTTSPNQWTITTTWPSTWTVELPGQAPVQADAYRITLTAPGTLPGHLGALTFLGKDVGGFDLIAPMYTLDPVSHADPAVPRVTRLLSNVPNPFNPQTTIRYDLAHPSQVTLRVFDVRGRLVDTLVQGAQSPGRHQVVWNGTDARQVSQGSGVYFYTLRAGDTTLQGRMVLLK